MLALDRLSQRRKPRQAPAAIASPSRPLTAGPSHVLRPRTEDLAGSWSAHAHRRTRALPESLHWAAPLLDAREPTPVLCSREQVRALVVWHQRLPTYEQLSFTSERRATAASARR
jgi:hypothetical protein